jgi:hypothetical protein
MATRRSLATPQQLADYLSVPEVTLRQWRYKGVGPHFNKVGHLVRYDWADVEAWLAESRKTA